MGKGEPKVMGEHGVLASENQIKIMEVCGTHSEVISKYAIRQLYNGKIQLVSGPGCPVCVIPPEDIDLVIEYARSGFTIATFGDLIKVPGTMSSLSTERACGGGLFPFRSPCHSKRRPFETGDFCRCRF